MNLNNLDLINETFYPGWLMVSQLRSGQEIQDGDALYRRACRWVAEAREALTDGGYSTATRQVFHLSMAPETGWYLRGEHQSVCERVSMTEECFFQAVDRLA